jgi:CRP-like cAMP-binding protein
MLKKDDLISARRNRLLAGLPEEDFLALAPHMELVTLSLGNTVVSPDEPIPYAYFPLTCLLSMVMVMSDGSSVESGAVGLQGMSGLPALLGAGTTPMQTVVQIPGEAIRIKSQTLKEEFDRGGALQNLIYRYIHALIITGSQSAACNRLHMIEARLARWLLMSSDGVNSEELAITHEFLAAMLGVRRAGVTEAAGKLQESGLIKYRRRVIEIIDRGRLERAACECYGNVRTEFERLLD